MASEDLRVITCEGVAELLRGPLRASTVVVDVRSEDYEDAHVSGALQWESFRFSSQAEVDALIDQHLQGKERVVLHCAFSQQRGPLCANKLATRLRQRCLQQPAVLLMSGGFSRFFSLYGDSRELVQQGS